MHFEIAMIAYLIDHFFGEFERFKWLKHPIVLMGNYIIWFENRFYKDSVFKGAILSISLILIVLSITLLLSQIDSIILQGILASFALSSKMLYDSVKEIIFAEDKRLAISMLVSRDTNEMSESDINKAAIETYAENLSDGVIAPLFYLILFGLPGAFVYKAVNTLDSMVGYKNEKYKNFGKFSAKLDDLLNLIPARITALIIALLFANKEAATHFHAYGQRHESPNAGHPISAMALCLKVSLGGPTSYFGKLKDKPYFGYGKKEITQNDLKKALSIKTNLDALIVTILMVLIVATY